jgi:hypothetical protein
MRLSAALALLDSPPRNDEELAAALAGCRVADGPHSSVEAVLHAVGPTIGAATVVGHTHPTAVNAILCSGRAKSVVAGPLFPDQLVVCGRHPLFVPYEDPGIPLALEVRDRDLPPEPRTDSPRAIGTRGTPDHAIAAKAARILLGSFAAGGPQPLPPEAASRIETRPDEDHRQAILGLRRDRP